MLTLVEILIGVVVIVGVARYIIKGIPPPACSLLAV
nr:C4-dicarboxylate transporter DcuC [Raoultella sp. NCTC 9187]